MLLLCLVLYLNKTSFVFMSLIVTLSYHNYVITKKCFIKLLVLNNIYYNI